MKYYALSFECGIQAIGSSVEKVSEIAFREFLATTGEELDLDDGVSIDKLRPTLYETLRDNNLDADWISNKNGVLALRSEVDAEDEAAEAAAEQAELEISDLVDHQSTDGSLRREMIEAMARAAAQGHLSVAVTKRGNLAWTRQAAKRIDQKSEVCPLAGRDDHAAEEVAVNLGDWRWKRQIEDEAAKASAARFQDMAQLGQALFGEEWVSPMARALEVEVRTAQRWVADTFAPAWVPSKLPAIAQSAIAMAAKLRGRAAAIEAFAAMAAPVAADPGS